MNGTLCFLAVARIFDGLNDAVDVRNVNHHYQLGLFRNGLLKVSG